MKRPVSDWDLASSAQPEEIQKIFKKTIPTGIEHGTVTVLYRRQAYEITTLRGEGAYSDGRRPDSVHFVSDIEEDLARRDFTVNAIAYDPVSREVVDPWGGIVDLKAGLIRAVRDPGERFLEDGLRVLRGARFCASLGFELEQATEEAISDTLETFKKVSAERVHDEWHKALAAQRPSPAFDVMRRTGILSITCVRLAALEAQTWEPTMERLDRCAVEPALRLAALLLDAYRADPTGWVDAFLRQLRTANTERKTVLSLLKHHRLPAPAEQGGPQLRRWLAELGPQLAMDVMRLAEAGGEDTAMLKGRVEAELASEVPLTTKELALSGRDLMAALERPAGPWLGEVLRALHGRVLETPQLADRATLLEILPEVAKPFLEEAGE